MLDELPGPYPLVWLSASSCAAPWNAAAPASAPATPPIALPTGPNVVPSTPPMAAVVMAPETVSAASLSAAPAS